MNPELRSIVERMVNDLRPWLDQPSPAGEKIARMREEAASLQAELGAGVLGDMKKQLEQAEAEARRARKREAADAIAFVCRDLGVVLEPRDAPKRRGRKRKSPAGDSSQAADAKAS